MKLDNERYSEILLQGLRMQAELALAKINKSITSQNTSIKGACREEAIREFIRDFLPNCYAINHGEVFSKNNDRSKQVDVIIHDELFSPYFKTEDGGILIPCEGVYGIAEVKSNLNSSEWKLALDNVASVKSLKRPQTNWTDILPNRKIILSSQFKVPENKSNPYIGIIVGLNLGLSAEKMVDDLNQRLEKNEEQKELLPDMIACVNNGHLITRYRMEEGMEIIGKSTLGKYYDGFRAFYVQDFVLSSFHLGLNLLLSGLRLRNQDLSSKWLDELLWVERKQKLEQIINDFSELEDISPEEQFKIIQNQSLLRGDTELLAKISDLRNKKLN